MRARNARNGYGIASSAEELFDSLLSSIDKRLGTGSDFKQYQGDPVGFVREVLNEDMPKELCELMESIKDNPVTIAQSCNAFGKTWAAARVAIWWFKCFQDSQVYASAAPPEGNLKRLLFGEINSVTEKHPDLFKNETITTLNISRSARCFVAGVTIPVSGSEAVREAKFSGKHSPHLLFILDEGDAIPDEVYRGIEGCMSSAHARLLVMFNPRCMTGEAYRMIRDGRANVVKLSAFTHPNVVNNKDEIPGAVNRQTTVRRINQWSRPLVDDEQPDSECFELPSFLDGATAKSQSGELYQPLKPGHYKIMNPAFSYMVLGKYPAQGSTKLISREWISMARSRWDAYVAEHGEKPPQGASAIMGQDVSEFGSDSNVACFRYGGFVERLTTWSGVDLIETGDRAAKEYQSRKVIRAAIDATGLGAGVAPHMQRERCLAMPVKVAASPTQRTEMGEFKILRDQLWWSAREWLRTDTGAMLPPDEELIEELLCPTYEVQNGKVRVMGKKTMRELLRRSPDRADALCLTFAPIGVSGNYDLS